MNEYAPLPTAQAQRYDVEQPPAAPPAELPQLLAYALESMLRAQKTLDRIYPLAAEAQHGSSGGEPTDMELARILGAAASRIVDHVSAVEQVAGRLA